MMNNLMQRFGGMGGMGGGMPGMGGLGAASQPPPAEP